MDGHDTKIVDGSVKRSKQGGIEFHVVCCEEHLHSVHIMAAHRFTPEELQRVVLDHVEAVAEEHHAQQAALKGVQDIVEAHGLKKPPCDDCG